MLSRSPIITLSNTVKHRVVAVDLERYSSSAGYMKTRFLKFHPDVIAIVEPPAWFLALQEKAATWALEQGEEATANICVTCGQEHQIPRRITVTSWGGGAGSRSYILPCGHIVSVFVQNRRVALDKGKTVIYQKLCPT
jgi:hypothetical protein